MDPQEYESGARSLSPDELARERAWLEQEREREAQRERERLAQEEQARLAREAALAARPLGVRLIEARCSLCHPADYYESRRRGRLGWWFTVLRMKFVNGAPVETDELGPIVEHLASAHAGSALRVFAEWAAALTLALLAGGSAWLLGRRFGSVRRRLRSASDGG